MNTIYLLHGEKTLTRDEFARFKEGDSIFGADSSPECIKRFKDEYNDELAKKELSRYHCTYIEDVLLVHIEEYALEYCTTDDEEEFISGSDYNLASRISM